MTDKKTFKANLKRQRDDRMRSLRVVKYLDCSAILTDSPVEVTDGYIVSDRDTYEVFASFVFKNVDDKLIKKLTVRLDCYLDGILPYAKPEFNYCHDDLTFGLIGTVGGNTLKLRDNNKREYIARGETFGSCVYIPIPDNYFTKLEIVLENVEFTSGERVHLGLVAGGTGSVGAAKRYKDLDDISKMVYTRLNIYQGNEMVFPTTVIPTETKTAWLCCCGTKNIASDSVCAHCGREKDWQMRSITADAIKESAEKAKADPTDITMHDKSRYRQDKMLESKSDIDKKTAQYEKAMQHLADMERQRQKRNKMLLPKILISAAIIGAILLVYYLISEGGIVLFPYST